jgi:AraC-like DNA-binding protein
MKERDISEKAVEFILSRKTDELGKLTEEKIAQSIGTKISNLSCSFKVDQKITIPDFILREKLYRAYLILREGSKKTIAELSDELGFVKVEDFNIEFENYFAITPKNYKDLRRNLCA